MLFSRIISAALLCWRVAALPIDTTAQDSKPIEAAMQRLTNQAKKIDKQFKSLSKIRVTNAEEAYRQTTNLLIVDWDLAEEMRISIQDIQRASRIGENDVERVLNKGFFQIGPENFLSWMNVKPMVKAAGRIDDVLKQLKEDHQTYSDFMNALQPKLPSIAARYGVTTKADILNRINMVIQSYKRA
jgi:hypothetical protein